MHFATLAKGVHVTWEQLVPLNIPGLPQTSVLVPSWLPLHVIASQLAAERQLSLVTFVFTSKLFVFFPTLSVP